MNEKSEFINIISEKSEYIKHVRNKLGYKQEYMAALMGISQSKYSMYEKFADYLDPIVLKKIAQILEIDYETLESYVKYDINEQLSEPDIDFLRSISAEIIFEAMENEKMDLLHKISPVTPLFKDIFLKEKDKIDIEMYLDGQLGGLQLEEVKERLKQDEEFRNTLAISKEVNDNLRIIFFKEELNDIGIKHIKTNRITLKRKKWFVAASISIMLVLGVNAMYTFTNREPIESSLYKSYYSQFNVKKGLLSNSSSYNIAKLEYSNGEYERALILFKELPNSLEIKTERDFFIGLTLMEIKNYKVASEYLEKILESNNNFEYSSYARWYLGLCYLKLGEKEKTLKTFETLMAYSDFNHKEVRRILKKLKD